MKNRNVIVFVMMIGWVTWLGYGAPFGMEVTRPAAGDIWCKTVTYTIHWNKAGAMDNRVKIRLMTPDGSTKIAGISEDTENDGSFEWTVPGSVAPGVYIIRVKTLDNQVYDDSGGFKITNCSSSGITLTAPKSGDKWQKTKEYQIKWTKSGLMHNHVKIRLYNSAGTTKIHEITSYADNNGIFKWTIPLHIAPGNYVIRVKTLDNFISDDSQVFSIIPVKIVIPPGFKVFEPQSGTYHLVGQFLPIKWGYEKVFKLPGGLKFQKYQGNLSLAGSKPTVKIEIRRVNCPPPSDVETLAEEIAYKKYSLPFEKIKKLLKIPWAPGILLWQTIVDKTPDDGFHQWRITGNFKKGCYLVRVTKTADSNQASSKMFHIIPSEVEEVETLLQEKR